jgi:hypothetical protein
MLQRLAFFLIISMEYLVELLSVSEYLLTVKSRQNRQIICMRQIGLTIISVCLLLPIALGYGLYFRGSRVRFLAGTGDFSLHHCVQNGSGAHPASYPAGTRGSFPGIKWPGHEAGHSPPSSAEVKEWVEVYTSTPPIRLHSAVLS